MTVIRTWGTNPTSGTASATAARPAPMPRETRASRSIVPGLLAFFVRLRFGAACATGLGAGRGARGSRTGSGAGIRISAPHRLHRDRRPARWSSTANSLPQPSHENAIIADLRVTVRLERPARRPAPPGTTVYQ